jgi:hypothetical protein
MMIALTVPEIRRPVVALIVRPPSEPDRVHAWSHWRRRRQYQARLCHYRKRGYLIT